jgi:hypothetical protein
VAPTIGKPTANPNPTYNVDPVTITVAAADDVGVAGVAISWSGQYSGSAEMSRVGGSWQYTFTPPTPDFGTIIFVVQARDAAGNLSNANSVTVDHQFFG